MAICRARNCSNQVHPKRKELGYHTCIECGSPKLHLPVVPVNKSNYIVGSMHELQHSYNTKGFLT